MADISLITYNEALEQLCDWFDEEIAPTKLGRSNTNVIYLLLKAMAKGWEVINNTCFLLNTKFNPKLCSNEDLESIAKLVGTAKLKGSKSGLYVTVANVGDAEEVLPTGTYTYVLDEENIFTKKITTPITLAANQSEVLVFLSNKNGAVYVTAQSSLKVSGVDTDGVDIEIPENLSFSCIDNADSLGLVDETNNEFRTRILEDTNRVSTISQLETELKNLPSIFDCKLYFNASETDVQAFGYTVKPFHLLIFANGDVGEDFAETIVNHTFYPTVATDTYIEYKSETLAAGAYKIYYAPFAKKQFGVSLTLLIDTIYTEMYTATTEIRKVLIPAFNLNKHIDYVTEKDIYDALKDKIVGVQILNVSLMVDDIEVPYVSFNSGELPRLNSIIFGEA